MDGLGAAGDNRCGMDAVGLSVGRHEELGLVGRALESGPSGGVVVMGTAGVGKTRLAREVVASRRGDERGGVRDTCGGWRSVWRVRPLAAALDAPGLDRLGVMMLARRAVLKSAGEGSAVLVVDDAHLLDDASAALVHQLVMARAIRVILTVRSGGGPRTPSWPCRRTGG